MSRFSRIFSARDKYSSCYLTLLSTRHDHSSRTVNGSISATLLFATSSLSLYEIYKRHRLHASSIDDSIVAARNSSLLVNAQKSLTEKIPYSKQYNFIADVVEHVAPAVVHIEVDLDSVSYFGNFTSTHGTTSGSGFIIDEQGVILTNAHVVRNRKNVRIKLADGQRFTGTVQSGTIFCLILK
jgi:S1-C subfamily serine protease